jgi:hypothetical protein
VKNFAIGCFAVLLVLAVAGGGVAWFKFIKPGMEMASSFVELGEEFEQLNNSVENDGPYSPPEGATLDAEQLNRFLAAQGQMRQEIAGRMEELEAKFKAIDEQLNDQADMAGIAEAFGAYGDIADLLIFAKNAQVKALNAHDFSLGEYAWVRNQAYLAIGQSVREQMVQLPGASVPENLPDSVSEETVQLVEPHREELLQSLPLAYWGL